jgi:hypothetical protein
MVEVGRQWLNRVMEVEVGGDRADSRDRRMPSVTVREKALLTMS